MYPFWDLITMAIGRWVRRKTPNKLVYCSKAVAICYKIVTDFDPWRLLNDELDTNFHPYADITPEQLWDLASLSGKFNKVKPLWLKGV
jgi:hypothetical protein